MASSSREERLQELSAREHQEVVLGLLVSSNEVKIAVPCSVLSKGASAAGSKVVVKVRNRAHGPQLALDCGKWWRGAPTTPVWMDYRQLLLHANDDALRALHNKLVAICSSRSRGLARTQSVPGRILLDELGISSHSASGGGSSLRRSSSIGVPSPKSGSAATGISSLKRTSSTGIPAGSSSIPSPLRRASSVGLPECNSGSGSRYSGTQAKKGASSQHRLSTSGIPHPASLFCSSSATEEPADRELLTPQKGQQQNDGLVCVSVDATGAAGDSSPPCMPTTVFVSLGNPSSSEDSELQLSMNTPQDSQHPRVAVAEWSSDFGSGSTSPLGSDSPTALGAAAAGLGRVSSADRSMGLARQPTFSQPYFAEFEDNVVPAAAPEPGRTAECEPKLAAEDSGDARMGQLSGAQGHMTSEELHEVDSNFNHVFVPPWAVPVAPQQRVVRAYCEAGVQTGTGASIERPAVRHSHTASDAVEHFEAFMQHFAAGLPHLAMALADLHLTKGGADPLFIKSQYYFNSLLQLKDEMTQVAEKLQPQEGVGSSTSWLWS